MKGGRGRRWLSAVGSGWMEAVGSLAEPTDLCVLTLLWRWYPFNLIWTLLAYSGSPQACILIFLLSVFLILQRPEGTYCPYLPIHMYTYTLPLGRFRGVNAFRWWSFGGMDIYGQMLLPFIPWGRMLGILYTFQNVWGNHVLWPGLMSKPF